MDPNQITTTFIPKRPITETIATPEPISRPLGFLLIIAGIVMVLSGAFIGGMYWFTGYTANYNVELANQVAKSKKSFEINLVNDLVSLDRTINYAELTVANHTVLSPVFDILETYTLDSVRLTKFDFKINDSKQMIVLLGGEARDYQSIALQAKKFNEISAFRSIIFSDFSINQREKTTFNVTLTVSPELLAFAKAPLKSPAPTLPPLEIPITDTLGIPATINDVLDAKTNTPTDTLPASNVSTDVLKKVLKKK